MQQLMPLSTLTTNGSVSSANSYDNSNHGYRINQTFTNSYHINNTIPLNNQSIDDDLYHSSDVINYNLGAVVGGDQQYQVNNQDTGSI